MHSNALYGTILLLAATCSAQQYSSKCTDVKVETTPDPSKVDTVCILTFGAEVTYQRQYVGYGQTNMEAISEAEAHKLLDRKLAWVTLATCSDAANQRPRKERKQARLDCEAAWRAAK
jgi:hypothetical protein